MGAKVIYRIRGQITFNQELRELRNLSQEVTISCIGDKLAKIQWSFRDGPLLALISRSRTHVHRAQFYSDITETTPILTKMPYLGMTTDNDFSAKLKCLRTHEQTDRCSISQVASKNKMTYPTYPNERGQNLGSDLTRICVRRNDIPSICSEICS